MRRKDLRKEFEYIKRIFFPRWDRKREWTIKRVRHLPAQGECREDLKKILIRDLPKDRDELRFLLIHEICHTGKLSHGKRWQSRMLRAADRAEKQGHVNLSKIIIEDVEMIKDSPIIICARKAYGDIEDIVTDCPTISFKKLVKYEAKECGMYPKEFLKRFTLAKKYFLSAKAGMKELKKPREKLRD